MHTIRENHLAGTFRFVRPIALGLLILVLVVGFRAYGVVAGVAVCWLLFRFTAFFDSRSIMSGRFWVYGYLVVSGGTLAVCAPFREFLLNLPALPMLADLGYQKLPIDRVVLALTTHPDTYRDILAELQRPGWYRDIYHHIYPAIFVATYASLAWFSIALPMVFSTAPANADRRAERNSLPANYLRSGLLVVGLLVLCVSISVDALFLPGSFRSTTFAPLITPFLPVFVVLAFTAFLVNPDYRSKKI